MNEDAAERLGRLPAEIRDSQFALIARATVSGVAQAIADTMGAPEQGYISVSLPNGATVGTPLALAGAAAEPRALCQELGTLPAVFAYLAASAEVPLEAAGVSPFSGNCAAQTSAAAERDCFPPGTRICLCPGSGVRLDQEHGEELSHQPAVRITRSAGDPAATASFWLGDPTPLCVVIAPGSTVSFSPAAETIGMTLMTGVAIVDDMMRVRAAGRITEVATILGGMSTDDVCRYLQDHPAASVLIGYGLLRTEEPERLFDAFERLPAQRPDFSDLAVLAGEAAARMARHEDALAFFVRATEAGLPCFSFGVNYLVDRLRTYASQDQGPVTDPRLNRSALSALELVQTYAPVMLHDAVLTSYQLPTGADLSPACCPVDRGG